MLLDAYALGVGAMLRNGQVATPRMSSTLRAEATVIGVSIAFGSG